METKVCHTAVGKDTDTAFRHPLDPLTRAELSRAAQLIRDHYDWGADLRVETIDLDEPAKDIVRRYVSGAHIQRLARFNIYRRGVMASSAASST
jgi:primary-amine oxidase